MQNCYFGDIGDYGKYGLLRFLSGVTSNDRYPKLSLGFMWYLLPDGGLNADGGFISYLNQPQNFSGYDPELFDVLKETVRVKNYRNVKALELSDLTPNSLYYDKQLVFPPEPAVTEQRRNHNTTIRQEWFNEGLSKLKDCDVIFLDPDNGLEVNSYKPYSKNGPKYVSREELRQVLKNNLHQTVVLYQHIARIRGQNATQQIGSKIQIIKELGAGVVYAVPFSNFSQRVYFIIPSHKHYDLITERVSSFRPNRSSNREIPGVSAMIYNVLLPAGNLEKLQGFSLTLSGGMLPLEVKIYLTRQGLVCKSEDCSNDTYEVHKNYIQPSEQAWAKFYQQLDNLGVSSWVDRDRKSKLESMSVCDAGSWKLYLERGNCQIDIGDMESYYPKGYGDFRKALKELILSTDSSVNLRML